MVLGVKIGLIMNMANNQWMITKALRRTGVEADLVISARDFGMGLPHWEEAGFVDIDPYAVDMDELSKHFALPRWVKVWNPRDLHVSPQDVLDLLYMAKTYDILQLSAPSVVYLQFMGKPFIVHEAGWIRKFPFLNGAAEKLARRGYSRAECVVMTNPDCYAILAKIKHRRERFIPFIVETERYKPDPQASAHDILVFFHPARHVWDVKGNDRLLRAFGEFIEHGYKAKLVMVDWGTLEDTELSKELVRRLGIEKHVEWLSPLSKPRLIEFYNRSDAVFDQFILGSYGTTAPEAMSCEKPVVMYLDRYWNEKYYGEIAPVLNVSAADEIFNAMVALTDSGLRRNCGEAGRRYVIEHHSPESVVEKYVQLYEEVLG